MSLRIEDVMVKEVITIDENSTVKEGADTAVWLSTADKLQTGRFYKDRELVPW